MQNWAKPVTKNIVHSFRSVVTDSGANLGFIVSVGGFQSGAGDGAAFSNIMLVDWDGFQEQFVKTWFERHMVPRLRQEPWWIDTKVSSQ